MPNETKHFSYYTIGSFVSVVSSYLVLLLVTNNLPKDEYATFALYNSLFSLALIAFNFGTKESVFKSTSTRNNKELFSILSWFFSWQVLLLLVCGITFFFDSVLATINLGFLVLNWLFVSASYNRGQSDYFRDAVAIPLQRFVWLLLLFLATLFVSEFHFIYVFVASLFGAGIALIATNKISLVTHFNSGNRFSPPKTMIKFFWVELSIVAYTKVDVLMLNTFSIQPNAIANYYLSLQVFEAAILLLAPVSYFFFNRFSKSLTNRVYGFSLLLKYSLVMFALVFLGQLAWSYLGNSILETFFPKYDDVYDMISLFIWALYPISVNYLLSSYLILKNREVSYAVICFVALIFFLSGTYTMIPIFEEWGVIYSRLSIEVFVCVLLAFLVYRTRTPD